LAFGWAIGVDASVSLIRSK